MNGHCQLIRLDVGIRASEGRSHELFVLGRQGGTRDLPPALESFLHLLPIRGRGKSMPARAEVLHDGTIGGEEPLGLAWGLEPLHVSLA